MKDDERYLLGAAQANGSFVPLAGIKVDRCNNVLKTWSQLGWVDAKGCLTAKGMVAKGAIEPVETVPIEPVEVEPVVTFQADVDVFDEESVTETEEADDSLDNDE